MIRLSALAAALLAGPAAAERLRIDGVEDGPLLTAVAWHTVGDPRFGRSGKKSRCGKETRSASSFNDSDFLHVSYIHVYKLHYNSCPDQQAGVNSFDCSAQNYALSMLKI